MKSEIRNPKSEIAVAAILFFSIPSFSQTKYPSVQNQNTMTSTQTMEISGKFKVNEETRLLEEVYLEKLKDLSLPATEERLLLIDKFGKVKATGETTLHPAPTLPVKLFPYWRLDGNSIGSGSAIANPFIGSTDNADVVFKTANTERMRITGAGNVNVIGNLTANCVNAGCLNVSGTTSFEELNVNTKIKTARIVPLDGDSLLHFGESSITVNDVANTIFAQPVNNSYLGIVKGLGLGGFFAFGRAEGSVTIGEGTGTFGNLSPLINDNQYSLMVGFKSNIPTLYVGPSNGVNTTGNVGIGTTTVNSKLVVQGSTSNSTASSLNVINSDGNSLLFVRDDGNTGIGTTDPHHKLDVSGHIGLIDHLVFNSTSTHGVINWPATRDLWFRTNTGTPGDINSYDTKMIIKGDGNVGIGIDYPSYKLDVCGTIRAKEVRINLTGCDFVFDKDYLLPTVKQRRQKVLAQGYMLYMETAKGKDEFSLRDITQGLWQNTEEHELYLYNHDERIEVLEKTVDEQKKLIEKLEKKIELMEKK